MRVRDIREHFVSRCDWVDPEKTVDRVIIGDPDFDADRCLVVWMPSLAALREAVRRGIRFVVCHEPTFWNHWDQTDGGTPDLLAKKQFIEEHGLTILRLHDTWDRWPEIGIPWMWARQLGFTEPPVATGNGGYQHRYDIDAMSFADFARQVGDRCAGIGEPQVQMVGDPQRLVSRIGVGTGCGCQIAMFREMGCDCSIVCDDGSCYWSVIEQAIDCDHPVIRVNHATSEEPGMATLTAYLNEQFPGLVAEHLPQGCRFQLSKIV
jgi:putative NIF3 family GTP cyclohydrolase 1 type 2